MKKSIWALALIPVAFASCNLDEGEDRQTFPVKVLNHFSPKDADEQPSISESTYSLTFEYIKKQMSFTCGDLTVGSGVVPVATGEMPFRQYTSSYAGTPEEACLSAVAGSVNVFKGGNGNVGAPGYPTLTNLSGMTSSIYFVKPNVVVPGYYFQLQDIVLSLQYDLDDRYTVTTFPADCFYKGKTETTDDNGGKFETGDMLYRVVIDIKNKKANLLMYDAKFSDSMPMTIAALLVKDLNLEVTRNGYKISGTNVVPHMIEAGNLTQNKRFVFNNVSIATTNSSLTDVKVDYTVAGKYVGSFEGSYGLFPRYNE